MNASSELRPAPPLIEAKRVPLGLVFRDLLLTAVAWIAIIQSMRYGFFLIYDYLSRPIFELTHAKAPNLLELWSPLRAFVFIAFCLVIWLGFWAFYGTWRLRAQPLTPQPVPLHIREHANYLGVKEEELAQWRTYRIATIAFTRDNRLAGVSPLDFMATVAAAGSRD